MTSKHLLHNLKAIWSILIRYISRQPELRVWQQSDRRGNQSWNAYNPKTGEFVSRGSEMELFDWIERSYYP